MKIGDTVKYIGTRLVHKEYTLSDRLYLINSDLVWCMFDSDGNEFRVYESELKPVKQTTDEDLQRAKDYINQNKPTPQHSILEKLKENFIDSGTIPDDTLYMQPILTYGELRRLKGDGNVD